MIITIQDLKWSNWFSYGKGNYINFDQPVLQVMGINGTGKTSIPIILQEVYYGKNSKGKKKSSLPNRYLDKPLLHAESNFIDDKGNKYKIILNRLSTLKLQLLKNDIDISSHTTTGTYKTIQGILGLDFKTFSQLIYQSSTDKLDFLTATDANRKKFLITLFSLDKYIHIHEKFKKVNTELSTELTGLKSKISTIEAWIKNNSSMDFTLQTINDIPEIDDEDIDSLGDIRSSLKNITETNKKINDNNQLLEILDNLDTSILYDSSTFDQEYKTNLIKNGKETKEELIRNETALKLLNSTKVKINSLGSTCHSCGQDIADSTKATMLEDINSEKYSLVSVCTELNDTIVVLKADLKCLLEIEKKVKEKERVSNEVSRLSSSIDRNMDTEVLDELSMKADINQISERITKVKVDIEKVSRANRIASAHNSKVEVVLGLLEGHKVEISELSVESEKLFDTLNKVEIIKKAFSPSGLLSYKIDYLVKDLEKEINEYLGTLSSGKFQLIFKLENEKLNIEIIDEGMAVGIEELSAGELARINAATLLAIRKLMAAISSTKINVLFLDEILGVLDEGGKEMLIEVLHKEKDLSTLLVSHEYSHPLIPKITIIKENKISRIDNGR